MQQGRFNQSGDINFDNRPGDFDQLGFSFSQNFYFDKCLPMGAAVSCSLFEKCSSALHWYIAFCSQDKNVIHYLDDFLFGGEDNTTQCFDTLTTFQKVCKKWGVPLAEDKTVLPVKTLTFLGIEFDTVAMELRLTCEKLTELRQRIKFYWAARTPLCGRFSQ